MTPEELIRLIEQQGEQQDKATVKLLAALKTYADASREMQEEYDNLIRRAADLTAERCGLVVEAAMFLKEASEGPSPQGLRARMARNHGSDDFTMLFPLSPCGKTIQ